MRIAFQNVFNLFFIDHCFEVTWNWIFKTIFNLQWNCVAFPSNLFLKCATLPRISRWDPGQGILHSVSHPQLPKAFKHTPTANLKQYLPLKKSEYLHHECHVSFLLYLSQLCVQTQGQSIICCAAFFCWSLHGLCVCACELGQDSLFLLCLKLELLDTGEEREI